MEKPKAMMTFSSILEIIEVLSTFILVLESFHEVFHQSQII